MVVRGETCWLLPLLPLLLLLRRLAAAAPGCDAVPALLLLLSSCGCLSTAQYPFSTTYLHQYMNNVAV
jgi:hypothetical protein